MGKRGRCFGTDIMRGEGGVMRKPSGRINPGGGAGQWFGSDGKPGATGESGTSIFDPVLCEALYLWFCPPEGRVLDPFAGGSVRGIVAGRLGLEYVGIELRRGQIDANQKQAAEIGLQAQPRWIVGDAKDTGTLVDGEYDFLFSCPPYADLEIYSDDPRDLSTMPYEEFVEAHAYIIRCAAGLLKEHRFAAWVVSNVRGSGGAYRNLVGDTVRAFEAAGLVFWNDAVLVTAIGSLPLRVRSAFKGSRKLGKTHQNVLIFLKGDPREAAKACGEVSVSDMGLEPRLAESCVAGI